MLSEPARREFTKKERRGRKAHKVRYKGQESQIMRLGDGEACHLESEAKPKFLAQIEANMVRGLCWG